MRPDCRVASLAQLSSKTTLHTPRVVGCLPGAFGLRHFNVPPSKEYMPKMYQRVRAVVCTAEANIIPLWFQVTYARTLMVL